ncbi:MAG: CPBP family intramembrane metalloprotease domain-containing protein, partial [Propionibacterium sp.]
MVEELPEQFKSPPWQRLPLQILHWEMLIVLALSLGKSFIYSVLSIAEKLTRPEQPLNQQVTRMNTSTVPDRPWLDLAYQLAGMLFPLVPVALALYLLAVYLPAKKGPFRVMGWDLTRP